MRSFRKIVDACAVVVTAQRIENMVYSVQEQDRRDVCPIAPVERSARHANQGSALVVVER